MKDTNTKSFCTGTEQIPDRLREPEVSQRTVCLPMKGSKSRTKGDTDRLMVNIFKDHEAEEKVVKLEI